MAVDKNLFVYDLSVVAIMKNEAPYVKEWLDYHLLAGVNHFYIYDNESPDNLKEVLQPYIDAGLVTYTFYPGKCRQMESYIDAVNRFKFQSRYIAFIDGDEFVFPKIGGTITETVDEILSKHPQAEGLAIDWQYYGSNYQETADYSRGVLERFTRRDKDIESHVKSVVNPRCVRVFHQPHFPQYFEGCVAINELGKVVVSYTDSSPSAEKIVVNHYTVKSMEEYEKKVQRGNADHLDNHYKTSSFSHDKYNDTFDNSILKYINDRKNSLLNATGGGDNISAIILAKNRINYHKLFSALVNNLAPTLAQNPLPEVFAGKLETFLTCRALAAQLKGNVLDEFSGKFFEETALNALYKSLFVNLTFADIRLLISELPNILPLNYPFVKHIREICMQIIPQFMDVFRKNNAWREFTELDYLQKILRLIK